MNPMNAMNPMNPIKPINPMKRIRILVPVAVLLMLGLGCQSSKTTQKEEATRRWNGARSGVLYSLAKSQYEAGNFDKARQTINEAIQLSPQSAELHILSAKLAIEQGQLEPAEHELAVARGCDPANAEADYLSGVIYQRWRRTETAYEFYSKAADKAPAELAFLLAKAEMLVAMDRSDEALKLLQEKVVYFENSPVIRDAVGQLLVARGKYKEAVEMLRRASILAEDDLSIRERLGLAMFYAKDYREAEDVLVRLTHQEPYTKRVDLLIAVGECQLQLNKPREARANFETAAQIDSSAPQLWLCLAKAAMQLNDLGRAELSLKKALALNANDPEANLLQGYLRLRQDRLSEALEFFRKASSASVSDAVSLCMVGYALEKMGQNEQAMGYYAQALKLKPDDELARKLMAGVEMRE